MGRGPSGLMQATLFTGSPDEWDGFARKQAGFTHFHLYGWRSVVQRSFGHECLYLASRNEAGGLAGTLPLVRVKSAIFGHYLVSLPFVNYGGPIGTDSAIQALTADAVRRSEASGAKLLELRSRIPLPIDLPVSHRKITVLLDLPDSGDQLMKAIPSKVRSQVRRPQKEGVTVQFGLNQVEPFFSVFARHMRDLGTPTLPLAFFRRIAETFADSAWFGCAYLGGRPVACGAGFTWGDEFEMTWASSLSEYNRIAPNMLLYYAFMERAIEAKLKVFNFGRCTPDGGTHRFKRQWGSRDEVLHWYQRSRDNQPAATPSPDEGAFSWGPRIWKRLPLSVATAIGPRIVRYIP